MNRFAQLFAALDATPKTSAKQAALAAYLTDAPAQDALWTIALLTGRRPKRAATSTELRLWAAEAANLPLWLFEESYALVGDLAETIALVLPPAQTTLQRSLSETLTALSALAGHSPETRRAAVLDAWRSQTRDERLLFNKLITGGFRMGVSQGLMTQALATATGTDPATIAHRLMGDWRPETTTLADLLSAQDGPGARPYPFALASALDGTPDALGPRTDWLAEWKWDGIRGQLIARAGHFALWSRGEELLADRFPEFAPLADFLPPGTVLDGEVLVWPANAPTPLAFGALQTRISRKTVSKKHLTEAPARFLAYDLLEEAGHDLRDLPLSSRRARMEALLATLPAHLPLRASPALPAADWDGLTEARTTARAVGAEGLMLKRSASPYQGGRKRGDWWKWKLDPYSVDAVMIYAQAGHGRRAGLFSDFTFALRDGDALVPFAKAYSGLTDAEFTQITRWVNANTLDRFGPVRRVPPELVFEIGFEGLQESPRHKSGIALRFPRMLRWRQDKGPDEIDTLDSLRALLR